MQVHATSPFMRQRAMPAEEHARVPRLRGPAAGSAGQPWDEALSELAMAAANGGERELGATLDKIDRSDTPAGFFVRAIQLMLEHGALACAERLAVSGARRHPEDNTVRRFFEVLRPPRVRVVEGQPDAGVAMNNDWLRSEGPRYAGQWVALRSGALLASALSLRELKAILADSGPEVLVTRVD